MTKLLKRASLVAVGLLMVTGSAYAMPITVKVPFSFMAGGRELPAGQYVVDQIGNGPSTMLIEGEHGTTGAAIVMTTPADGQDPKGNMPALTFKRGEKMLTLSGIWESGNDGRAIVR